MKLTSSAGGSERESEEKAIEIVEKVIFLLFLHFFFSLLFLYRYYNYRFMDFHTLFRECHVYVRHRLIA